jgi:hypothetical protein
MKTLIDKISIQETLNGYEYCPDCQESDIEELMNQIVLDDDIEEAKEYACEISKQCINCRKDEQSDFNRM